MFVCMFVRLSYTSDIWLFHKYSYLFWFSLIVGVFFYISTNENNFYVSLPLGTLYIVRLTDSEGIKCMQEALYRPNLRTSASYVQLLLIQFFGRMREWCQWESRSSRWELVWRFKAACDYEPSLVDSYTSACLACTEFFQTGAACA